MLRGSRILKNPAIILFGPKGAVTAYKIRIQRWLSRVYETLNPSFLLPQNNGARQTILLKV